MGKTVSSLISITATTSHLALIMQNFHWHVTGPHFLELHEFFGEGYKHYSEAVDALAEQLRALDSHAPATLAEIAQHSLVKDPARNLGAHDMLAKLRDDYKLISSYLETASSAAQEEQDEVTADIFIQHLAYYQKQSWMIAAMLAK